MSKAPGRCIDLITIDTTYTDKLPSASLPLGGVNMAQQREGKGNLSEGGILEETPPRSMVASIDRINNSHVGSETLAGAAPPRVRNQAQSSTEEALVHA